MKNKYSETKDTNLHVKSNQQIQKMLYTIFIHIYSQTNLNKDRNINYIFIFMCVHIYV